jgi:hypothetical protein
MKKRPLNPFQNQDITNVRFDKSKLNPFFMPDRRGLNQAFNYNGEQNSRDFNNDNEVALLSSLIAERIQQHGFTALYIPRNPKNIDLILGEQPNAVFDHAFEIEMILNDPAKGVDHHDSIQPYGFGMLDTTTIDCSYTRLKREFSKLSCEQRWPSPGDLILVKYANKLFQILHIYFDSAWYLLGKNAIVNFVCQLFDRESESFDTGSPMVDSLSAYDEKYIEPFLKKTELEKEFNDTTEPPTDSYWNMMNDSRVRKREK